MGISNYTIIGCPSYYKYFDGKYPQINQSGVENSVMSCTPSSVNETKIFEIGMKSNAIYIKQTEKEILGFEDNDNIAEMLPGMEESMYEEVYHYNEQAKLFFSIEEWNNFYENNNISFAFGTRFHGNMEALRNGVPALWITHDSRTSELIETLHLPHISLKKANNVSDVNELYELCDMQSVYSTYRELCEKYVDFLNENGVQHKFSL